MQQQNVPSHSSTGPHLNAGRKNRKSRLPPPYAPAPFELKHHSLDSQLMDSPLLRSRVALAGEESPKSAEILGASNGWFQVPPFRTLSQSLSNEGWNFETNKEELYILTAG